MSRKDHYKQYEGKDTWRVGKTTGKAEYNKDGSLKRLDVYSTKPGTTHIHDWLKQSKDGSWKFKHETHPNH